jgi:hypothetical protein
MEFREIGLPVIQPVWRYPSANENPIPKTRWCFQFAAARATTDSPWNTAAPAPINTVMVRVLPRYLRSPTLLFESCGRFVSATLLLLLCDRFTDILRSNSAEPLLS